MNIGYSKRVERQMREEMDWIAVAVYGVLGLIVLGVLVWLVWFLVEAVKLGLIG